MQQILIEEQNKSCLYDESNARYEGLKQRQI